jgi:hypothetical protein
MDPYVYPFGPPPAGTIGGPDAAAHGMGEGEAMHNANGRPRWHRVVYRGGGKARSLGRVDEAPTRRALDPFHSRLRLGGVAHGELVLVDEATGRIVARRPLVA